MCLSCSSLETNCEECQMSSNLFVCQKCKLGYYLFNNTGLLKCDLCEGKDRLRISDKGNTSFSQNLKKKK